MSVEEKAGITCQVRNKETSANEPLTKYRNTYDGVKTGGYLFPVYCHGGVRYKGGVTLFQASVLNVGTCRFDAKGKIQ